MPSKKTKAELRSVARSVRKLLAPEERKSASQSICAIAAGTKLFKRAELIACYLASNSEVNCEELLKCAWIMKKRVFVPVIKKNFTMQFCELRADSTLILNWYGLPEPQDGKIIAPRSLDLVITPVVAFDDDGNRIGMGGGFYDRSFSFRKNPESTTPVLIGVAHELQKVDRIIPEDWDVRLDMVVTDQAVYS